MEKSSFQFAKLKILEKRVHFRVIYRLKGTEFFIIKIIKLINLIFDV